MDGGFESKGDAMSRRLRVWTSVIAFLAVSRPGVGEESTLPDETRLNSLTARFAPADLGTDVTRLPESERQALAKLVQAARVLDPIFLRQVWAGNESLLLDLAG